MTQIDTEMEKLVIEMYQNHWKISKIEAEMNISHDTIYKILHRNGIQPSRKHAAEKPAEPSKHEPPNVYNCRCTLAEKAGAPLKHKPPFNIKYYKNIQCVMHCPEKYMAEKFITFLNKLEFKWSSATAYTDPEWEVYGKLTCYDFNNGQFSDIGYYKNRKFKILEFADFDWSVVKTVFRVEDYPDSKTVMHCPQQWQADLFCLYLYSIGKTWRNGMSYKCYTGWDDYKVNTCYNFNRGTVAAITYFSTRNGFKVLEFEDFDWSAHRPKLTISGLRNLFKDVDNNSGFNDPVELPGPAVPAVAESDSDVINFQHYRDKIIKLGYNICVTYDGKIKKCSSSPQGIRCDECIFKQIRQRENITCWQAEVEWGLSKYQEKK